MMMMVMGFMALMFFAYGILCIEEGKGRGALLSFLTAVSLASYYFSNIQS